MKKNFSKTIMVILAVLLTLVLISTSTVSGIFAKYVIEKDATTIVSLKKFGVKLDLVEGDNYDDSMRVSPSFDGSDIGVEVTLSLAPGDDYEEIFKFVASIDSTVGKATVDTNIKVKAEVTDATGNFQYSGDNKYYVPVGFYVNKTNTIDAFKQYTSTDNLKSEFASAINSSIKTNVLGLTNAATADTNGFYVKQIAAKDAESLSFQLGVGVFCPDETTDSKYDKIITELAENSATIRVKFTVSLEQDT